MGARLFAALLRHPREAISALLIVGCGGAIAWNALLLQKVRHPAPLFAHGDARPAPVVAQPVRPVPAASGAPAEIRLPEAPSAPPLPPRPPAETAPAVPPPRSAIADLIAGKGDVTEPRRVLTAKAPAPAPRDAIADIIRMGGPVPIPPGNVGGEAAGNPVLAGQRALAKLGYDVKPDGIMGSETRQAIERFERDRHLPVTGELGARTARELAARSGMPVS